MLDGPTSVLSTLCAKRNRKLFDFREVTVISVHESIDTQEFLRPEKVFSGFESELLFHSTVTLTIDGKGLALPGVIGNLTHK
jgi:hypothetical protein